MILFFVTLLLGIAVIGGAGCRLIHMNVITHKVFWQAAYLAACWGGVSALGELTQGRTSWSAIPLLVAIALHLWGSRMTWRAGPPLFTRRDYRDEGLAQ